jgi:hypothetical protein
LRRRRSSQSPFLCSDVQVNERQRRSDDALAAPRAGPVRTARLGIIDVTLEVQRK